MTHAPSLRLPDDIARDLAEAEQIITVRMHSRPIVAQTANAVMRDVDKLHLRAALVMLAAHPGRYDTRRVVHAAAAAELIHSATIVHDSLINEAARRRGKPVGDQHWNGDVALMAGDYLLALAAAEMALAPDARIIGMYSRVVMTFCEGKLAPVTALEPLDQALAQHEFVAESRTAALLEAAARVGVVCGSGDDVLSDLLGQFGRALGMALHIAIEVRDYEEGDDTGRDLRAGRITLPLIYAARDIDGAGLATVIGQHPIDARHATEVIALVRRTGVPPARARAQHYAQQAMEMLTALPPGATRDALAALVDQVTAM
ncbi:MAG: polyprenyl synthetase family protein [Roseiflexus sp.]